MSEIGVSGDAGEVRKVNGVGMGLNSPSSSAGRILDGSGAAGALAFRAPRSLDELDALMQELKPSVSGIDASRGQPPEELHALSDPKLDCLKPEDMKCLVGAKPVDLRNYSGRPLITGIPQAREFFGTAMGESAERTVIWNNSSLEIFRFILGHCRLNGAAEGLAWNKTVAQGTPRFIVSVPAYDRDVRLLQAEGYEVVGIPSLKSGPNLEAIRHRIETDPQVVGLKLVPRFSNPEGWTLSGEQYLSFAHLQPSNPGFIVAVDDAYFAHHLGTPVPKLPSLIDECEKAGCPERAWLLGSTSKVTYSGAGIGWMCSSSATCERFGDYMWEVGITANKIEQLREVEFISGVEGGLEGHMQRCAEILKPRFQAMYEVLVPYNMWTNKALPNTFDTQVVEGGYFIPVWVQNGTAVRIVELLKEKLGITITNPAGCYPKGYESPDNFLRLCPTRLSPDQARLVAQAVTLCAEYASVERQTVQ